MRSLKWMQLACLAGLAALPVAAHGQVVISQAYGSGGNAGSVFLYDYVELYNKGALPVSLAGYAIQYASAAGSTWNVDSITAGTIQPGRYFLVQLASNIIPAPTSDLPTPDFVAADTQVINMSGGAGKFCLTSNSTGLTGACPTGGAIVDFVGYGTTATCSEGPGSPGSNAPGLGAAIALFRGTNGCDDTNNNATNFSTAFPAPRNSSSPAFACPASTNPSGVGNTPQACPGHPVVMTITVTPGANPPSTGITVRGDTSPIGGSFDQPFFNDGTNGDAVANDNIWSRTDTVFVSQGFYNISAIISDAQARTGNATATVQVLNCNPAGFLTATPGGVCPGESSLITVTATPGQQPTSTGLSVLADLSQANGSSSQSLYDDGTHGDVTVGDNVFSFDFAVPTGLGAGAHQLSAQVSDDQGRTSTQLLATLNTGDCIPSTSTVVISQLYGGGGNAGATLTNDFIELFNRGTTTVDITGWSVQYASGQDDPDGFGVATDKTDLTGFILPGHYYLIQEAAGTGGTQSLPTPDAAGGIAMSATRGAIALVRNNTLLGLDNCASANIADMVGYGNGTTPGGIGYCAEGLRTGTLTNATAVLRRDGGCHDVDNNGIDFSVGAPAPRNSAIVHQCTIAGGCTADFNCDGDTGTDADIESFFSCLSGTCPAAPCANTADFNNDGDIGTDADIESFFRVLSGGPC